MNLVYRREPHVLGKPASLQATRPTSVIAQVEEIVAEGAAAQFGDIRHRALVVLLFHPFPKARDEFALETAGHRFLHRIALVDEELEQCIGHIVAEAQLVLICLPGLEIRTGRFCQNGRR